MLDEAGLAALLQRVCVEAAQAQQGQGETSLRRHCGETEQ
jgi:hypothetical protein